MTDTSKTTKVGGYINPNRFPISIWISSYGCNITVLPGEYAVDFAGNKVNDPSLDVYTNNRILSKVVTNEDHPYTLFTRPQSPATEVESPTITGTSNMGSATEKMAAMRTFPGKPTYSSTTAMSIEEAVQRGLIRRPGGSVLDRLPYVDGVPESLKVESNTSGALGSPELPKTADIPEVSKAIPQIDDIDDGSVEESLGEDAYDDVPLGVTEYVCSKDGKTYRTRHGLLQHARKCFPNDIDEIMKPYPPTSQV